MEWRAIHKTLGCSLLLLAPGCARDQAALVSDPNAAIVPLESAPKRPTARVVSAISKTTTQLASARKSVSSQFTPVPSHARAWRADYSVLPIIDFDGWQITIHNVRNSRYRTETDYDVRFYDMSFLLTDLATVDFVVVPFQSTDFLAHTMLSFGLNDGRHFLVSVEARMEQGEVYSTVKGVRNQFELMYVIGDERDLIPLRTRVRNVDCFLYPGKATPADVQRLFVDIIHRVNGIAKQPEFYHTVTNNCTTNLVDHVNRVYPERIPIWDWRLALPGRSDRLAYELGLLDLPNANFESLRPHYRINTQANLSENDPQFSQLIRQRH